MSGGIAIIGAGIGGLTLAVELRRRGVEVDVYEAATDPQPSNDGVLLPANATRHLDRLGLEPGLGEASAAVDGFVWRDGHTGATVGRCLSAEEYAAHSGAPFYGIRHGDLHALLSKAFGTRGLHLGHRLTGVTDHGTGPVRLDFAGADPVEADVVIGADGAGSVLREHVVGYDDIQFSGCVAWRGVVPRSDLTLLPDPERLQLWMGPDAHLMHHPVADGAHAFLLVRRQPGPWAPDTWSWPAEPDEHVHAYAGWHPAVVQMISAATCSKRWALLHRPPLTEWSRGRVTLLGDAAHLMLPHHGQGTAQAIEDAVVLADCLTSTDDRARARASYEVRRRDRARRIQVASLAAADVLHLPEGPRARGRNKRLGAPDVYERHLAWIHDHDVAEIGRP
ncbi:salicylate hydroxylase [Nocardioides luteus]|uniref:Salicylate hydroxylase n=1 Tax=Nocardioides luteus TaxID=1844 RepID=A0ABQ5T3I2_9ACTN|nr:FAD-dependent monooxygenase [Nocardioides luteus]MDR7309601.1 salicylate hydroxylase [Nocardioides luteus]GGR52286.1 salicylate hydroxylase [Nocardioides luteus]GLJ70616.1 salicylate hydroxylase [Nocardioides luteus]